MLLHPPTLREVLPGHFLFDCERLLASLSPARCAQNFVKCASLSCEGCEVGRHHAEEARLVIGRTRWSEVCTRCGRGGSRLIGGCVCVSCFNAQRECLCGRNAKGTFPAERAAGLHRAFALLAGLPTETPEFARLKRQAVTAPTVERLDGGFAWLEAVVRDLGELPRLVARLWPGASVLDAELGPSLAQERATQVLEVCA